MCLRRQMQVPAIVFQILIGHERVGLKQRRHALVQVICVWICHNSPPYRVRPDGSLVALLTFAERRLFTPHPMERSNLTTIFRSASPRMEVRKQEISRTYARPW